jgi:serine/threonine protein kinase
LQENIVKFRDSFEEFIVEGNVAKVKRTYVMEYVREGSLWDYLNKRGGTVKETTAQHIVRQIIEALGYMQKVHNMVHRDLKPAVSSPIVWDCRLISAEHPRL